MRAARDPVHAPRDELPQQDDTDDLRYVDHLCARGYPSGRDVTDHDDARPTTNAMAVGSSPAAVTGFTAATRTRWRAASWNAPTSRRV